MGWVSAVAPIVSAGTAVIAAQNASANGKFNQSVANRNAAIKEQEVEAIEAKKELDIARFEKQFERLEGETITKISTSGAELSGSGLRIMRYNAEQAELEKDMIAYNAEINKSRKFEEANFAKIQGDIARQNARMTEFGYYSKAGETLLKAYG